jgi:plasmid stabilization system protein ParE
MLKLTWAPRAKARLTSIPAKLDDSKAGADLVDRILEVAALLQTNPELGERAGEGRFDFYVSGTTYLLVYVVGKRRVRITALIHTSQDKRRNRGPRD